MSQQYVLSWIQMRKNSFIIIIMQLPSKFTLVSPHAFKRHQSVGRQISFYCHGILCPSRNHSTPFHNTSCWKDAVPPTCARRIRRSQCDVSSHSLRQKPCISQCPTKFEHSSSLSFSIIRLYQWPMWIYLRMCCICRSYQACINLLTFDRNAFSRTIGHCMNDKTGIMNESDINEQRYANQRNWPINVPYTIMFTPCKLTPSCTEVKAIGKDTPLRQALQSQ